ncbi:hypothetical protein [Kineococcus sp. NPDC059986]|uniref:hypothetical protein n=1 Tax=Kineococcus sp. NPDC059986 TaxID=3155538 RepID=UPI00344C84D8
MTAELAKYRKTIVAVVAFLVTVAATLLDGHLIPDQALPYVSVGIAVAGSYGVYRIPNDRDTSED